MPATCPNIGPAQRRRRLRSGIAGAAAALALGFILAAASAPALLRALVFIPLALAAFGFLQYREKT
jgi:hypothetical protein